MPELVMTGYKTEGYETSPDYNDEVGDKQTVGAINEIEGILKIPGLSAPASKRGIQRIILLLRHQPTPSHPVISRAVK
ncbi:MAG: hypothetical protein K6G18_08055 [Treponema sp.]|nr:hypothetical protein [Treponema sp.]